MNQEAKDSNNQISWSYNILKGTPHEPMISHKDPLNA
jgi:hypothetical protein